MMRARVSSVGLLAVLVLSLSGLALTGYYLAEGDPFQSTGTETFDDGVRDRTGPEDVGVIETTDDVTPTWLYPVAAVTIAAAFVFLLMSGNMYMRSRRGKNLVRNDLLDLITVNPGINLSNIRRELQLSQGAVSYHIMKLEKLGEVFSEKGSKERRYYPSSMGYKAAMEHAHQDEIRSILANDTSRKIVNMLQGSPRTQNEIVQKLNVSPSTVHWHMERMKRIGMVTKETQGRSVLYELEGLPDLNT